MKFIAIYLIGLEIFKHFLAPQKQQIGPAKLWNSRQEIALEAREEVGVRSSCIGPALVT